MNAFALALIGIGQKSQEFVFIADCWFGLISEATKHWAICIYNIGISIAAIMLDVLW